MLSQVDCTALVRKRVEHGTREKYQFKLGVADQGLAGCLSESESAGMVEAGASQGNSSRRETVEAAGLSFERGRAGQRRLAKDSSTAR